MSDTNKMDRMVDGELDRDDERQLLLDCEANDNWRELALAYVESQVLKREMSGLLSEREPTALAAGTIASESSAPKPVANAIGSPAYVSRSEESPKSNWNAWSLAAAILLSLGVGYGMGWGWQNTSPTNPSFTANQTNENGFSASMQFTVSHPSTRELQQVEIPVLRATDLGPDWQQKLQAGSEDDLLREMQSQGLNLRQERTLTPVRLPNGQRVVVPVDYFYEQPFQ